MKDTSDAGEHFGEASRDVELEALHVYFANINMTVDVTQIIHRVSLCLKRARATFYLAAVIKQSVKCTVQGLGPTAIFTELTLVAGSPFIFFNHER
jgi:hypothetical protein